MQQKLIRLGVLQMKFVVAVVVVGVIQLHKVLASHAIRGAFLANLNAVVAVITLHITNTYS
jgi:hypothetical protein